MKAKKKNIPYKTWLTTTQYRVEGGLIFEFSALNKGYICIGKTIQYSKNRRNQHESHTS